MNSERFTLWEEHYSKLLEITSQWKKKVQDDEGEGEGEKENTNGATLMTIGKTP